MVRYHALDDAIRVLPDSRIDDSNTAGRLSFFLPPRSAPPIKNYGNDVPRGLMILDERTDQLIALSPQVLVSGPDKVVSVDQDMNSPSPVWGKIGIMDFII